MLLENFLVTSPFADLLGQISKSFSPGSGRGVLNIGPGQLAGLLPWLLLLLLALVMGLFYLRRRNSWRRELAEVREENGRLLTRLEVEGERLAHSRENFEQARAQENELRAACEKLRREANALERKLAAAEARLPRIDSLKQELIALRRELADHQQQRAELESAFASQKTKMEEERKAAREKIALLEEAEKRLGREFENLANRIFEEKQKKFTETSKAGVETLLGPMREQLQDFRKRVDEVYDKENEERISLRTEIKLLKSLNERISSDALNLTNALKGESKTRGNWGEMQLERLLEESGLGKGREYELQVSLKSEEGRRLQPDVVVHLPDRKDVIIDSKVSLLAYEQFHSSEDDAESQGHLRRHIAALRTHFKSLSGKKYQDLIGVHSLDLVIMFVPIEPALLLAFEHEPRLFNEAYELGVLLTCPSTLMATLQIIHNIWRYEYQNRNALEIATEAGRLHDQFVRFVEALDEVGRQLGKARESYEKAHKRLLSGGKQGATLVGRVQKLKDLGARAKKEIDPALLEEAGQDNEAEGVGAGEPAS